MADPARPTPIAALHPFRVHFDDGRTEDIRAESAAAARDLAKAAGIITKIKLIRETDHD